MSILVCIAIPGRRKTCLIYEKEHVRIKHNIQIEEISRKKQCDKNLCESYVRNGIPFSERRRQELKDKSSQEVKKLSLPKLYELIVKSLEKHL